MKRYLLLMLITAISGVLSGLIATTSLIGLMLGPGLIFGVILGIYFLKLWKTSLVKTAIWTLCSTIAYCVAGQVVANAIVKNVTLAFSNPAAHETMIHLPIAGAIGTTILIIGTVYLIQKINIRQALIVIFLGALMGFAFDGKIFNPNIISSSILSFVLWQMVVGITLGMFIEKNIKKTS